MLTILLKKVKLNGYDTLPFSLTESFEKNLHMSKIFTYFA